MKNNNEMLQSVFIIDDEMDICFLLSNVLKRKGVAAEYAHSITEAETALENKNPAIIFLDNYLPDGLGVNFIREINMTIHSVK